MGLIQDSLEIRRELGDPLGVARRLRDLAPIAIVQGDTRAALGFCEQSMLIFREHADDRVLGSAMLFRAWAYYLGGDPGGAEPWMQQAWALNRSTGNEAATSLNLRGLALTAWSRGDIGTVRALLTDYISGARSSGHALWEPAWLWGGFALAVAERRDRTALRLAGGAQALAKHAGMNMDQLMEAGSRLSLEEMLAEALAEPTSMVTLTPREPQVAELLAQGLTNGQIAQRLFISKRTVESHVDHMKGTLGVTSRRRVVAWLSADGPAP